MDWLKKRLSEGSTYAGLGLAVAGIGQLAKVNEAPAIAEAITTAGPAAAAGDWVSAAMIIAGSLAMLLKEKGGK